MKLPLRHTCLGVFLLLLPLSASASSTSVHTTWLWHLHQPIYWPDRAPFNHAADHYQNAWDTIQLGNVHPDDTSLTTVFGEADRVNAYQGEPSSTVSGLLGYPNAGVQVNYSGALMENVQSLAAAGQLGYAGGWNSGNATARTWTTSDGKPRMDLVNFTYHHAMAPLVSDETLEMELRIHQQQMQIFWGTNVPLSRGYFPAETCFSERMIPILNKVGVAWAVVANNHLTRSCADFPLILGTGGENCDIPNPADQLNPAQGASNYQTFTISRGCSPTAAMPFAYQVHYARYVDPGTGVGTRLMVVPADQALGWDDSYSTWDVGLMSGIQARNNPAKPSIVLLAHDGDNAWSGGNTYYTSWVSQFAGEASAAGYEPSTVEQFLAENPPNTNDVVHVEDGGWVFADSDFGSPSYINWNWPPSYSTNGLNVVDPSVGVTDKGDNWRVIIATENRVKTAQQVSGITPSIDQVRDPGSFSGTPNGVELGWHYYLASLDSGFVYFGCTADECLRAIVAQSNACRNVDVILNSSHAPDTTPPTVFLPQRHPWNPGGTNFGVQYGYKVNVATNTDFWVWTYAYDVSGITNVSLLVRVNGSNPPTSDQFKTYAGGPLTGGWRTSNMTQRVTPDSSGYTPQYMADYYYAKVSAISNAFVDYYISAADAYGNAYNSPIQHVWVGAGSGAGVGGGGGGGGPVTVSPNPPGAGNPVTIQYVASGRNLASANPVYLHLGWNTWNPVVSPDPAMTFNPASNWWQYTAIVPTNAAAMNCAFNNGSGTWDNNGGANWNFSVSANSTPQAPPTPAGLAATLASASQINVSWPASPGASGYILNRDDLPIVTTAATNHLDTGLTSGSTYCYTVEATNSIGDSAATAPQCATIQAPPAPVGLSAVAVATNQINLSWGQASAEAAGYLVSHDNAPIATTGNTNYSDTGLATDSLHCYTVTATNIVGSSTPTSSECATTLTNKIGGSYGAMTVAGTFLNPQWNAAASNMVQVVRDNWQLDVALANATNFQFKFAANGTWTTNWGAGSQSQFAVPLSGTAQLAGANIQANGTFNGTYRFAFNDQTLAYSLAPLLASPWASVAVAGTFNGWNTTSNLMTLVSNSQWQCNLPFTVPQPISPTNIQFKFVANGNWATNWGASNEVLFAQPFGGGLPTVDTAQFYGSNITANLTGSGAYLFLFNDQTLAYSLLPVGVGAFPPMLVGPTLSGNTLSLSFTNVSGSGFTVMASTNLNVPLSNWTVVGPVTETSPGMYQFSNVVGTPGYFYRVRWP